MSNPLPVSRTDRRDFDPAVHAVALAHGADARLEVLSGDGEPLAGASLWWRDTPALTGQRVGVIGHYHDAGAAPAAALLGAACEALAAVGCTIAVGPMDGCTWRSYRFVTEPGTHRPFLLEPRQPRDWPRHWINHGFGLRERYRSTVSSIPATRDPAVTRAAARLESDGIRIRPFDGSRAREELERIHRLSCVAFAGNPLYTALSRGEFLGRYEPLLRALPGHPSMVAESDEGLVGFLFALPDLNPREDSTTDTVVVKTAAVLPGRRFGGLGRVLLTHALDAARAAGMHRAIHALMHVANRSANAARGAEVIREYGLYARALA